MKFFIDESGDFSLPSSRSEHRAAVVVGLSVSDRIESELFDQFRTFVSGLSPDEIERGEPKGSLLHRDSLIAFCEMLLPFDGLIVTPTTLDLSALVDRLDVDAQWGIPDRIQSNADSMLHESVREALGLKARQFRNLSIPQSLRLNAWAVCVEETLQQAVIFLSNGGHEGSWESVRFVIDRVSRSAECRENAVFEFMLPRWLIAWSRKRPLALLDFVHTPDHPFVRQFDNGRGILIDNLVAHNIIWEDSKRSDGLQIADIASHIIYQAVCDLDNKSGIHSVYTMLMRKSVNSEAKGPGLWCPVPDPRPEIGLKYRALRSASRRSASVVRNRSDDS